MRIWQFRRQKVVRQFGQWCVTAFGVENLNGPCRYDISTAALGHPWWSDHMADKNWVDRADFDAALRFARQYFQEGHES